MSDRHETEHKSFGSPDETREFPKGHPEILEVGGGEVGRLVFEPGWRWSNDVKPLANTDSCEAPHFQYHVSGQLASSWTTAPSRRSWSTGTAPATTPRATERRSRPA